MDQGSDGKEKLTSAIVPDDILSNGENVNQRVQRWSERVREERSTSTWISRHFRRTLSRSF